MEYISTILVVDDNPADQSILEALLMNQGYRLVFACNGQEALKQASAIKPDLILTDVMMPGIDGFELCRRLRSDLTLSEIPIILITSLDDRQSRLQGFQAGADDFLTKPFDSIELRARVRTITRLNRYHTITSERNKFQQIIESMPDGLIIVSQDMTIEMMNPEMQWMLHKSEEQRVVGKSFVEYIAPDQVQAFTSWVKYITSSGSHVIRQEVEIVRGDQTSFPADITMGQIDWNKKPFAQIVVRDITTHKETARRLEQANSDLTETYDATLVGLVRIIDTRNKETEMHTYRVTEVSVRLARALNIQSEQLEHIRRGALLHDIGKLAVPDHILFKTEPLTEDEWAIIRKHPVYAYEWLKPIKFLGPSLDIPYCHHEKWDGTGYPRKLKREEIPFAARIFAVVDVWESLRSVRPYRDPWAEERVRDHLRSLSGTHFDPRIVETFLTLHIPF